MPEHTIPEGETETVEETETEWGNPLNIGGTLNLGGTFNVGDVVASDAEAGALGELDAEFAVSAWRVSTYDLEGDTDGGDRSEDFGLELGKEGE